MGGFYSWHGKGGSITIYDDGVLLGDVTTINFTGAGQSGSVMNGTLTENIPGGGGGGSLSSEIPTGAIDGSNVTYTVINTPIIFLTYGNVLDDPEDYSVSGTTITMTSPLLPGNVLQSFYNA